MEFREININDRAWINELLKASDFMGCEYMFANNMAWRRLNDTLITRYKDFYVLCSFDDGQMYFTYPAGHGDIDDVICEMKSHSEKASSKLIISSVTKENLSYFTEKYGDGVEITTDPSGYDYIYNSSDLINLSGKKYHSKRNHIKNFKKNDWSYKRLEKSDFADCITFAAENYNNGDGYDSYSSIVEQYAINMYFTYYDEMELRGGILRCDGKIVGFTIGEPLNSQTFDVHIEKALPEVQGAYPTLCNEFLKAEASDYKYINREEDLGIEGLRKSKMSYHPAFLLEKYTVRFK